MVRQGFPGCVGDLMTRDPLTVSEDAPLLDAAELMDTFEITGLPVVDQRGRAVGVLSQSDMVRAANTQGLWTGWPGLAVRHLMSTPAITVRQDLPLEDVSRLMERERIHRVVVVDDDMVPIGILSLTDLIRLMAEEFEHA